MVALVTVIGALEGFYNWRSRWILMEEAQYRLNRLRDDMDFYLVTTGSDELSRDRLRDFFVDQQAIWSDVSRRWIEFRRIEQPQNEQLPIVSSNVPTPDSGPS